MKKLLILIITLAVCSAGCSRKEVYTSSEMMINTVITLTAVADDEESARKGFDAAYKEIERIGAMMSPVGDSSDVVKINNAPADEETVVSKETFEVIRRSLDFSKMSDGGFDITYASAGRLWNFNTSPFIIPSADDIKSALRYVGYYQLILNPDSLSVQKSDSHVRIGLGGIAKGYIIDASVAAMKGRGIKNGIVNAGGDIRVFGMKKGKPWLVAVQHPREKGAAVLTLELEDGEACATSGDYERMAIAEDGKRYHHIIDPRTGYPTESFSSVTVITDNAADADAYATSFFTMGISSAIDSICLQEDDRVQVIFIDRNMNTYASSSLKKRISLLDTSFNVEWLKKY